MSDESALLRSLPSVERLVSELAMEDGRWSHAELTAAARQAIAEARSALRAGDAHAVGGVRARALALVATQARPSLRRVINASGVILQTNLGRAPLSEAARAAMDEASRGYSNLEFDLEAGIRGSRHEHVRELLARTTGAEDGIALNNNAAALLMVLQVFAQGREVVVSRGQAVEIGGGFRIPDVLRESGATLVEVGTTNRTYPKDYAAACNANTAALLRVHASNFAMSGFVHETTAAEMADVARANGVLFINDLGSGCLLDTREFGLASEPTVQESVSDGADLSLFSGDKLLGGPQCGLVVGRHALIEALRGHPLARALRVDKTTIAALNATLRSYVTGRAVEEIPVWHMVSLPLATLQERARRWADAAGPLAELVESTTMVGGGSLPGQGVPTWCCAIRGPDLEAMHRRLRTGDPALVGRIEDGALLLDPRCVAEADDEAVMGVLGAAG